MSSDTTRCDICHAEVWPENDLAEGHICEPCLKDWQVAERVSENSNASEENAN